MRPEGARLVEGSSPLARGLPRLVPGGWRVEGIIPARAGFTRPPLASPSWPPDHPRSRGVYAHVRHERALAAGSSPLARGLRLSRSTGEPVTRIIPARAGFTSDETVVWRAPADHPRSRGVYGPGCGSRRERAGIIPARAGFTLPGPRTGRWRPDHPRSRGVYTAHRTRTTDETGSSPLARGLLRATYGDMPVLGIIPARAGFTATTSGPTGCPWDHPRSRGVYGSSASARPMAAGSSPLARGLPGGGDLIGQGGGIIPARAGFTSPPCTRCARARDHPRSRGVYSSCMRVGTASVGSSPLARGLPVADPAGLVGHGDHPRSRGVYPRRRHRAGGALGSSPLARGLPTKLPTSGKCTRIIPARAGFTPAGARRRPY